MHMETGPTTWQRNRGADTSLLWYTTRRSQTAHDAQSLEERVSAKQVLHLVNRQCRHRGPSQCTIESLPFQAPAEQKCRLLQPGQSKKTNQTPLVLNPSRCQLRGCDFGCDSGCALARHGWSLAARPYSCPTAEDAQMRNRRGGSARAVWSRSGSGWLGWLRRQSHIRSERNPVAGH